MLYLPFFDPFINITLALPWGVIIAVAIVLIVALIRSFIP